MNTQTESTVRPTGRLVADVRRAFAQVLAEEIVATAWPAPARGTSSPASNTELLNVAEEALDPRLLAAQVIQVAVQIMAAHAGIPPGVARMMAQAAGEWFTKHSGRDPNAGKVQVAQYVDLTFSAEDGSLINSPALPQIVTAETANVIDKLPASDAPASPVHEPPPARPPSIDEPSSRPATSSDLDPNPHPHPFPDINI